VKTFFVLLISCITVLPAIAQNTSEDSVKAVITTMFAAMRNANGNALFMCFADSAVLQTIARDKDGNAVIKNDQVRDFAKLVETLPKGGADERIVFDVVKVDGQLASVWTPYEFYYNGQFSHCGVNSFQLVRTKTGWKIQYLIDTRRKQGCK
jgi:hypothetical protein